MMSIIPLYKMDKLQFISELDKATIASIVSDCIDKYDDDNEIMDKLLDALGYDNIEAI